MLVWFSEIFILLLLLFTAFIVGFASGVDTSRGEVK